MPNLTSLSLSSGAVQNTGTISTLDNSFGTAGTSNANILSVQGVSGGVNVNVTVANTPGVTVSGTATVTGQVTVGGVTISSSSLNVNVGNPTVVVSGVTVSGSSLNVNVTNPSFTVAGVTVTSSSLNVNTVSQVATAVSGVTVSSSALNVNIGTGGTVAATISGVTVSGSSLNVNVGSPTVSLSGVGTTASSTAPTTSQVGLVVSISPNSLNPNGRTTPTSSAPVVFASQTYQAVGAASTNVILSGGGGGSTGDYLDGVLVIPSSVSPGIVQMIDSSTSTTLFVGGTTSISNLVPFFIPVGAVSAHGSWRLSTGSNVTAVAVGNFT